MDRDYEFFIEKIKRKTDIDLGLYKETQMKRRLTSLRDKKGYTTFHSYYEALDKNSQLLEEFLDWMTINVSEFFRNPTRWDFLKNTVLPELIKTKSHIKIWSAACSTGEEPYTVAILLKELNALHKATIIATDIDKKVLEKAKMGRYHERTVRSCPKPLRDKYFSCEYEEYHLKQEIKQHVTFKHHNLLQDFYEKGFDLIICRNVLIYFTEEAKDHIYEKFNDSLNETGVLFVGSTEQIFHPESYGYKIEETFFYRKL